LLALLASALTIGTASGCEPISGSYDWEIVYEDNLTESYVTNAWQLTFTPRPYRRWQARTRIDGGAWSPLGVVIPAEPFPGDTNYDCTVSGFDYSTLAQHWGQSCPP